LANSKITGIKVSALNKEIDDLKKAIIDKLDLDIDVSNEALFLSNERHLGILNSVVTNIDDALGSLDLAMPNDIVVSDLELAYSNLQELLGNTNSDSLLDELFSRFCLGK
jgi:tRNA modification GTPase